MTKPTSAGKVLMLLISPPSGSKSRGRINSAFLLTDQTLDFVDIIPTLQAPFSHGTEPWLIAFGVVMGLVTLGVVYLLGSSLIQNRRYAAGGPSATMLTLSDERASLMLLFLLFSSLKKKNPMDEGLKVDIEEDEDEDTPGRRRQSSAASDGYYNATLKDDERFTKM